jgi:hypothetical protein
LVTASAHAFQSLRFCSSGHALEEVAIASQLHQLKGRLPDNSSKDRSLSLKTFLAQFDEARKEDLAK